MNGNILLIIIPLAFVLWLAWLVWLQDEGHQKRKNDDLGFEGKPKRKRHIEPEHETFEHTQEVSWPTTVWMGDTRWTGLTHSEIVEFENAELLKEALRLEAQIKAKEDTGDIPDWLSK